MVDSTDFSSRLDAALAMNGLDNAAFATAINPVTGQQTVNRWRSRGKVGQPSVDQVARLLPRTNMDWLQKGRGHPERVSEALNVGKSSDVRQSRSARLSVPMLASALGVLEALESRLQPQKLRALDAATRLRDFYERLSAGEDYADLIAQVLNEDDQGSDNAQHGDAGAGADGR